MVEAFWIEEVKTSEFLRVAAGKEIGHKIGDMVDEKTTKLIKDAGIHPVLHQFSKGSAASRSMGDFWLEANGTYNPVNVKAGQFGMKGNPNLVSIKRVLKGLASCRIDSYYLLIMKIATADEAHTPHVYFVDMFDFLDFTNYNSGPGQLMLKEGAFYGEVDRLYSEGKYFPEPRLSIAEKVLRLYAKLEAGDIALTLERDKKRLAITQLVNDYPGLITKEIQMQKQKETYFLG